MKAHVLMIAGAFLAALPAVGHSQVDTDQTSCFKRISSYTRLHLEKAATNYEVGLKSGNDGLVESSITYSTLLRVAAPELNLGGIRAEMEKLIMSGNTPAIRYKAYLASIVFENPRTFTNALGADGGDGNQFFGMVAEHVSKSLLGYKAH
jgi:hypothetical protein